MSIHFQSIDQVYLLLDQMGSDITSQMGHEIQKIALEGPKVKRRDYPATAYEDQIEKNTVYLGEATWSLTAAMFRYLWMGEPILSPAEISDFVTHTRIAGVHKAATLHLNYIRFGCSACDAHDGHGNYVELRKLAQAGDRTRYMEEMEYHYVLYQGTNMVGQNYLSFLLHNQHLAASAQAIAIQEVGRAIGQRVFYWTHACLGDFRTSSK